MSTHRHKTLFPVRSGPKERGKPIAQDKKKKRNIKIKVIAKLPYHNKPTFLLRVKKEAEEIIQNEKKNRYK